MGHVFLLAATMFVSSGAAPVAQGIDSFKAFAHDNQIRIESPGVSASGSRIIYDGASNRLTLEGSADADVVLNRTTDDHQNQIRARKIVINLKNRQVKVEGIHFLEAAPK